MVRSPSYQSVLNMLLPSTKEKREDHSLGYIGEAITKIESGKMLQVKSVREYNITPQTLARKCKNKIDNMADKRSGPTPFLGEESEKDLFQWALFVQKQGLPVGGYIIIQKIQDIHSLYLFLLSFVPRWD